MTALERKREFIKWAKEYPEHRYTMSTISTYASTLERVGTITGVDIGMEFFEIDSKDQFIIIKNISN